MGCVFRLMAYKPLSFNMRNEQLDNKSDMQLLTIFPEIPVDMSIKFFSRDRSNFEFLSNFYIRKFTLDGQEWCCVESYYQSQKSINPIYRELIRSKSTSPSWCKFFGDSRIGHPRISKRSWFRRFEQDLRDDWDDVKVEVMKKSLFAKFSQNPDLRQALLKTGQAKIIEDNTKDEFWGIGQQGNGKNMMGKLIMELRFTLKT